MAGGERDEGQGGRRALRRGALRRAAARPGEDPDLGQPDAWEALTGGCWCAYPPASGASLGRCARLLAALPIPASRAALILAREAGPAGLPAARLLAAGPADPERAGAAWIVARHGTGAGDARLVAAALGDAATAAAAAGAGGGRRFADRARRTLDEAGPSAPALAAARAAFRAAAALPGRRPLLEALETLGGALPEEGIGAAAALLLGHAHPVAANFLVRHAPHLAATGALTRAGLLPGIPPDAADMGPAGTPPASPGAGRAAPGAGGARGPRAGRPGGGGALRRADAALALAWGRALG